MPAEESAAAITVINVHSQGVAFQDEIDWATIHENLQLVTPVFEAENTQTLYAMIHRQQPFTLQLGQAVTRQCKREKETENTRFILHRDLPLNYQV
jgi:uncharacterized cupredoxin-like copper-binding protein